MSFEVVRNDITKMKADVIVNTANPNVTIGTGVDFAIYEAAGREKLFKERKKIGMIPFGEVRSTRAYQLNARYIFHASGPVWKGGNYHEREILWNCYENCMKLAITKRCKSIAFPLMATGGYGYPKEEAMKIAIEVFKKYLMEYDIHIYLVVFDDASFDVSRKLFSNVESFINERYVIKNLTVEYNMRSPAMRELPTRDVEEITTSILFEDEEDNEGTTTAVFQDAEMFFPTAQNLSECEEAFQDDIVDKEEVVSPPVFGTPQQVMMSPGQKTAKSKGDLDSFLNRMEKTLTEYIQQLINKKGMSNVEVYKRANMDKKYFSKLIHGKVRPTKLKLLSLAVALSLNLDETIDLLRRGGYALSPCSKSDLIFEYYIRKGEYDIFTIDITLFEYGLPTVVNG